MRYEVTDVVGSDGLSHPAVALHCEPCGETFTVKLCPE
jgi:hypothetical protein